MTIIGVVSGLCGPLLALGALLLLGMGVFSVAREIAGRRYERELYRRMR